MIPLRTRIKEMKKLGMTEIKVDIETLEGLLEQSPERVSVDAVVKCTDKEIAVVNLILEELKKAREKHPEFPNDRIHQTAIVAEEAGELVRASLHEVYERGSFYDCQKEAIQTAAMAIRFITQQ